MITTQKEGAIALDIGNVCMEIHSHWWKDIFHWDAIPAELLPHLSALECGKESVEELLTAFHRLLPGRFSDEELLHCWNLALGPEIPGMAQLVHSWQQAGYMVIFFSDTSTLHLREVFKILSFASRIDGGIYSFEVGAQKPDPAMYQAFEDAYGRPVLYVDDRFCNIEMARRFQWPSVQFTGVENLKLALKNDFDL